MDKYNKPPLSVGDQLERLVQRGMLVHDQERAIRNLEHINYYRLRAYWYAFETDGKSGEHIFQPGTTFEDVLNLYIFDRRFRLLLMEAIERVEVSFRTRFANVLALQYGSHAYLRDDIMRSASNHQKLLDSLTDEYHRSREVFIKHYKTKYGEPGLPPVWAACEIMSFGQLSLWYKNLKFRKDRTEIASVYGIDEAILKSFMHHLTFVRNLAAHHSRLWNRHLTIKMSIPQRPIILADAFNGQAPKNIYNTLVMLGYLVQIMNPDSSWKTRLAQLLQDYPVADTHQMGFPNAWKDIPFWKT